MTTEILVRGNTHRDIAPNWVNISEYKNGKCARTLVLTRSDLTKLLDKHENTVSFGGDAQ